MKSTRTMSVKALLILMVLVAGPRMALAGSPATVTGAGGGLFGAGAAYNGIPLTAQRFGLGLEIRADGSAWGDIQVTLIAASLPGAPGRVTVEGQATSGTVGSAGQVTVSGLSSVTVAGGTAEQAVPFTIAITRSAAGRPIMALTIGSVHLPGAEVSEGQVTIR